MCMYIRPRVLKHNIRGINTVLRDQQAFGFWLLCVIRIIIAYSPSVKVTDYEVKDFGNCVLFNTVTN